MNNYSITLPSYSVGDKVYDKIGGICSPYGKTAVVIGGSKAMASVKNELIKAVSNSPIKILDFIWYGGECTYENVDALGDNPAVREADMVFAVGGGKALDTCKAYCAKAAKPVFTFPTIASTCAATTAVSIMYTETSAFKEPNFHKAPPVHAFIYTPVIAAAPKKYIWAGMGDTYAKYFEAEMSSRNETLTHYHRLGVTISRDCLYPLLQHGVQAMRDIKASKLTDDVEQTILAIVVTTGIASILLTAEHIVDYNSGLAHAVFYSLTEWEHIEKKHLHGEVVALGVLILLLTDGNYDMFNRIYDFNKAVSLPTCLDDIEMTQSDTKKLIPMVLAMKDIDHNPYKITEDMLREAFNKLNNASKGEKL